MRYCYHCGASMNDGAKFCPSCGAGTGQQQVPGQRQTPVQGQAPVQQVPRQQPANSFAQPVQPREPKKKHQLPLWLFLVVAGLLALVAVAAVVLGIMGVFSSGSEQKTEGSGYSSPEAAMEAYGKALSRGDVQEMLSTFAVETRAENYDFTAYLNWSATYMPSIPGLYCPDNSYGKDLSAESIRNNITEDMCKQYMNLVDYKNNLGLLDGTIKVFQNEAEAEAFVDCFNDNSLFRSVEFVRIVEPDEVFRTAGTENMLDNENTQRNIQRQTDIYGAQAMNEGCLEVKIDGEEYWIFLRQVQYDGKWYNEGFHGMLPNILGINVNINLIKVSEIR